MTQNYKDSNPEYLKFSAHNTVLFTCFFLSGFSGLLYQVVWLRLAYASFGAVTTVLSVVLSVFMLGLALGAFYSGKIAAYTSRTFAVPALQLYGICELSIGVVAICVPSLFELLRNLLLSADSVDSFSYMGLSALAIMLTLLPCCFLMGCTYPLMMTHMRQLGTESRDSFGFLYWANVSGAALGTIVSAYILIEIFGFRQCLWIGCASNIIAAILGLLLSRKVRIVNLADSCSNIAEKELSTKMATPVVALLFITGFVAVALEVVWSRVFMPLLGTSIYAFAIVLFTYLQSTAIGSRRYLAKTKNRSAIKIGSILAALSISALIPIVVNGFPPSFSIESVSHTEWHLRSVFAIISIIPFCCVLGYLTPMLIDKGSQALPQAAGKLYAINSIGCIIGPLFASYLLLPFLGARLSQLLLVSPFVIAICWLAAREKSNIVLLGSAVISVALFAIGGLLCGSYEEPREPGMKIYRDYASTVLAIIGEGQKSKLIVNGQEMTARVACLKMMGHFPVILHDGPVKSSLVICLGMGTTFRSLLSWQHDARAVELAGGVKSACNYFYPDLHDKLDKIVVDDGRRYLERSKQKFDIITIDPPPPVETTGSSLLYSREFCKILKDHLNKNGLLQQFFPTDEKEVLSAVARVIKETFPYVRVFHTSDGWGYHFIASAQPIKIPTMQEIEKRLPPQAIADLLETTDERDRGKPLNQFKRIIHFELPYSEVMDNDPTHIITDDRALNEYCMIRRLLTGEYNHLDDRKIMKMPSNSY